MRAADVVVLTWNGTEQSLVSLSALASASIADALRQGLNIRVSEMSLDGDAIDLASLPAQAVLFPVALGRANSGRLQQQLESAGLAFVGSGSWSCRATHDERVWRPLLAKAGVPVAPYIVCDRADDVVAAAAAAAASFPGGCQVGPSLQNAMPPRYGGVTASSVQACIEEVLATSVSAVIQPLQAGGRSFSLACLSDGNLVYSLPVVEVVESWNADRPTLCTAFDTHYACPAAIDGTLRGALDDIAAAVHHTLACVMSQIDVHLAADGRLAVNACDAAPLLLPSSLFARAAAGAGVDFAELTRRLVDDAWQRSDHTK